MRRGPVGTPFGWFLAGFVIGVVTLALVVMWII
jgi:hypothetical protein